MARWEVTNSQSRLHNFCPQSGLLSGRKIGQSSVPERHSRSFSGLFEVVFIFSIHVSIGQASLKMLTGRPARFLVLCQVLPPKLLRHHRTILQENPAGAFGTGRRLKNAGILDELQVFKTAISGQKRRQRPQTQLRGVALRKKYPYATFS